MLKEITTKPTVELFVSVINNSVFTNSDYYETLIAALGGDQIPAKWTLEYEFNFSKALLKIAKNLSNHYEYSIEGPRPEKDRSEVLAKWKTLAEFACLKSELGFVLTNMQKIPVDFIKSSLTVKLIHKGLADINGEIENGIFYEYDKDNLIYRFQDISNCPYVKMAKPIRYEWKFGKWSKWNDA